MIHTSVFHQAFEAHTLGDYPTAQRLYESLLNSHPEDPQIIHLLGLIAYEQKDYPLAREKMVHSLQLCPEDPLFQNNFGLVLEALGEDKDAKTAYLSAIHYTKKDLNNQPNGSDASVPYIDPYLNLGALLQGQGKLCEAAKFYYRGLRLEKTAPDLLNNLGSLYKAAWKSVKAEVFFRKALQMDPHHEDALLNLAGVCLDRGDIPEALMLYEKFREIAPNNPQGLLGIGACFLAQGDFSKAQSAFFQGLQKNPICDESRKGLLKMNAFHSFSQLASFSGGNAHSSQPKSDTSGGQVFIISQCALEDLGGGHQPPQISRCLSQMGHSVCYIHLFSNRDPSQISETNPFPVFQDIYIPQQFPPQEFQIKPWQQLLCQSALSESSFKILLFTVYSPYLVGLIPLFQQAGFQTAYWCIDDHEAFGDEKLRTENEALLAKAVDVCFASSQVLKEKIEGLTGKPCHKVPNGFSLENFPGYLEDLPKPPCPPGFLKGEEKTFVYWGNILTDWADEALLKAVAEARPQWAFNMIGTMVDEHPKRLLLPNIRYHGELPVSTLEAYGRHSDIGFINFKDNRLIRGVNPVKAFEYLASGLPIISTPMKEIQDFPNTLIVRTPEEFIQAVEILETQPLDHTHRRQFLKDATWSGRAQCFLDHMTKSLES